MHHTTDSRPCTPACLIPREGLFLAMACLQLDGKGSAFSLRLPWHRGVTGRLGRRYGARPLRRWMEKTILTDLSRMLVSGKLSEFAAVKCDVAPDGGGLAYKVEKAEPAPGVPEQQDSKRARWAGASKLDEDDEEMEE